MLKQQLEAAVGKPIQEICDNNFHDANSNHCAHFVSHMTDLTFDFNCKSFHGGNNPGANIRVHEIFAQCPKVGTIQEAPSDRPFLLFVIQKSSVNIAQKRMENIPQKHIGVVVDDLVYHYSNSQDKVVKWTIPKFEETFQRVYDGDQGLFYGLIPGSDLLLDIDVTGTSIQDTKAFQLEKRSNQWFATLADDNSAEFYVGNEINRPSSKFFGIFQKVSLYSGPRFKATDYENAIDHWAYLLEISGHCESKNHFNVINTYDRAKFTFGFSQMAAHTPNDNLILLFRRLTEHPEFEKYFPELKLINGTLHRVDENGSVTNLETVMNTGPNRARQLQLFMNFLNPLRKNIDEQEVLHAARLIHWSNNDKQMRDMQVAVTNEILQRKMSKVYHKRYDLDGESDIICAVIADIHHQGRASVKRVKIALNSGDRLNALIDINPNFTTRSKDLRDVIKKLQDAGKIGNKVYSAAINEFT